MDFNDIISSVAFGIGFLQMYDQVRRQDEEVADDEPVDKKMLYMTLFSSSLWLVYQQEIWDEHLHCLHIRWNYCSTLHPEKDTRQRSLSW